MRLGSGVDVATQMENSGNLMYAMGTVMLVLSVFWSGENTALGLRIMGGFVALYGVAILLFTDTFRKYGGQ